MIVAEANGDNVIGHRHFASASRICARSLALLRNAHFRGNRKGGQCGGAIVLPAEYFGGHNSAYSATGYAAAEQSTTANAEWARPAMHISSPYVASGGARAKPKRAGTAVTAELAHEVVEKMARSYLRKEGRTDVSLSSDGVAALAQVVASNMALILKRARGENTRAKSLTKGVLKTVVRLPEFAFLR